MKKLSHNGSIIPIALPAETEEWIPNPEGPSDPGIPFPGFMEPVPYIIPRIPRLRHCDLHLPRGCYQLNISTSSRSGLIPFRSIKLGTLRVENNSGVYVISGDTYRYSLYDTLLGRGIPSFGPTEIPVYPRNRYASYLKCTSIYNPFYSLGPCRIKLVLDEFYYTQPPAGSFNGSFPASPSRQLTVYLTPATAPAGFTGPYFTGQVYIGGVLQTGMHFTLAWVSDFYRKATVEVHTMTGAVAPAPVSGAYFNTIFQNANWQLTVQTDINPVPVPAGVNPNLCWSGSNLHNVMTSLVDFAAVDLDREWHMHLLAVPGTMGCGRGVMFDSINVPREGVATFSNDGYPTGDSSNFGTAANQQQRNVPRAFLRSAAHEITHGFNQVHQENEGGGDNSVMTTTPSVANFLSATGQTFPNDIFLGFNDHVRHHLIHSPDIVIRPGGMTFTAGHNGTILPEADMDDGAATFTEHPALDLSISAGKNRIKTGEPLQLAWEIKNTSEQTIQAPTDISLEAELTGIMVIKPGGDTLQIPPYVIKCDSAGFTPLQPGQKRSSEYHLFWGPEGFAFDTCGKHTIQLQISWISNGARIGVTGSVDIFLDYPVTGHDNELAALLLHEEVGKFIALGGHAYHLKTAVERIRTVVSKHPEHTVTKTLRSFFDEKKIVKKPKAVQSSH